MTQNLLMDSKKSQIPIVSESIFKYSAYYYTEKHKDNQNTISIPQANMIGILFFMKVRQDVIYNDKSLLALFDGKHRSGKSMSAVTIATLIDRTFWRDFENRIVQTPQEFMDAVRMIERNNIRGACIVVDEAGVSMSSDMWYETFMKCIQKTVEVLGYLNICIFFCAPVSSFIDSKLRKMSHYYIKCFRKDKSGTQLKIYGLEWSTIKKDFLYRKPKLNYFGQKIYVKAIRIALPPLAIIQRYKNLERSRKKVIISDLNATVMKASIKSNLPDEDIKNIITKIVESNKEFITGKTKMGAKVSIDAILVSKRFGIGRTDASYIARESSRIINDQLYMEEQIQEVKRKQMEDDEIVKSPRTDSEERKRQFRRMKSERFVE